MKMTQQEMADHLGVSRNYINMVENGAKPFSKKLARKLSESVNKLSTYRKPESGQGGLLSEKDTLYITKGEADAILERLSNIETLLLELLARKKNG